jgi:hypothetical protein
MVVWSCDTLRQDAVLTPPRLTKPSAMLPDPVVAILLCLLLSGGSGLRFVPPAQNHISLE